MIKKSADRKVMKVSELPSRWELASFGTGQVAELLGVEEWRIKNFASGKAYGLESARAVGTSRKKIRVFSAGELLKIGVAVWLTRHGLTAPMIGNAMRVLDEKQLAHWAYRLEIEGDSADDLPFLICAGEWVLAEREQVHKKAVEGQHPILFVVNLPKVLLTIVERVIELHERERF